MMHDEKRVLEKKRMRCSDQDVNRPAPTKENSIELDTSDSSAIMYHRGLDSEPPQESALILRGNGDQMTLITISVLLTRVFTEQSEHNDSRMLFSMTCCYTIGVARVLRYKLSVISMEWKEA